MEIKKKDLLKEEHQESLKGPITLYLTKESYEEFKKACEKEDVSPSRVLDRLIAAFLKSAA